MSTTSVPCLAAAVSSRTPRNPAALVMSTSSGVTTTGTPLTISTGNPVSGIGACLLPEMPLAVMPLDHEQGDVVASRLAADQGARHRDAGRFRGLSRHGLAEPVYPVIDHLAGALDQAIGVEAQQGPRRDRDGGHRAPCPGGHADQRARLDLGQLGGLPRVCDDRRE